MSIKARITITIPMSYSFENEHIKAIDVGVRDFLFRSYGIRVETKLEGGRRNGLD